MKDKKGKPRVGNYTKLNRREGQMKGWRRWKEKEKRKKNEGMEEDGGKEKVDEKEKKDRRKI